MDLYAFGHEVARALGDGWSVVPADPEREWTARHPTLTQAGSGANFWIGGPGTYGADKGKLTVHSNWPKDGTGSERHPYFSQYSDMGAAAPSISFAATKTPEVAAKDIARRFLPAFLPLYAKQAATVQQGEDTIRQRLELARAVAALVDGTVRQGRNHSDERLATVYLGHRPSGICDVDLGCDGGVVVKVRCDLDGLARLVELFPVERGIGQTQGEE